MTLTEFLLARIAEDEAVALGLEHTKAHVGPWDVGGLTKPESVNIGTYWPVRDADGAAVGWTALSSDAWHIARHDPARVLAECEAKRRIVESADEATGLDLQVDSEFRVGRRDTAKEPYLGDVILRALASVYANHPDFREEWRA
jgi:hypothetical protein